MRIVDGRLRKGMRIRIHGSHDILEKAFRIQQSAPCFPVPFDYLSAKIEFVKIEPGSVVGELAELLADGVGTILGSLTGTSTVTSYIESAAGVAAGARTGLSNIVVAVLFLCAVGGATWYLVNLGQQRLIEIKALDVAEVVARLSTSSRSVYAERVVNKLQRDRIGYASETYLHEPGNVPLPAQFLKFVGEHASKDNGGLYHYRPLSKWNLAHNQGLADSFQRWAWQQLEAQDRAEPVGPIDWKPVWRIETLNGVNTLRYMRADPASSTTCVECHNRLEHRSETVAMRAADGISTGKTWKLHQLMGALEINIPLDRASGGRRAGGDFLHADRGRYERSLRPDPGRSVREGEAELSLL